MKQLKFLAVLGYVRQLKERLTPFRACFRSDAYLVLLNKILTCCRNGIYLKMYNFAKKR